MTNLALQEVVNYIERNRPEMTSDPELIAKRCADMNITPEDYLQELMNHDAIEYKDGKPIPPDMPASLVEYFTGPV